MATLFFNDMIVPSRWILYWVSSGANSDTKRPGRKPVLFELPRCRWARAWKAPFYGKLIDEVGNETAPARLVRSAAPAAVIAIEILVKEYIVFKMGICLELLILTENWTSSLDSEQKEIYDAPTQLVRDLVESHHDA